MNEDEEFEFRLRAEQESESAKTKSKGVSDKVAVASGAAAIGYGLSKIKVYNDKLVTDTTNKILNKVKGKIEPIRGLYKSTLEGFSKQVVDSDTFGKALSVVPESIRKDFVDAYGSRVVDSSGRPSTTLGNLQKMELELKDFIKQPKFADKISAADYNVAEAAKALKQIRMSQLPEETRNTIQILDSQFGDAIKISDEIIPKIVDKNGKVNTKFLFSAFKNPSDAGTRQYLKSLKNLGVDLSDELKVIDGWVKRQNFKESIKNIPVAGNILRMTGKLAVGLPMGILAGEIDKRAGGFDPAEGFKAWYTGTFGSEQDKQKMSDEYARKMQKQMGI